MTAQCHWWNRWWHRRLRALDVRILLPAFQRNVLERIERGQRLNLDNTVDKMFAMHKALPGQEHWHCQCSKE